MEGLFKSAIYFNKQYSKSIKKSIYSKEGNSIKFVVQLGYFETYVSLLKVHIVSSKDFSRKILFHGSFGCIYELYSKYGRYAIKSQPITPRERAELNKKIDAVLEEYLYYKIAAAMKCGPKIENIFGYDIICYDDSI